MTTSYNPFRAQEEEYSGVVVVVGEQRGRPLTASSGACSTAAGLVTDFSFPDTSAASPDQLENTFKTIREPSVKIASKPLSATSPPEEDDSPSPLGQPDLSQSDRLLQSLNQADRYLQTQDLHKALVIAGQLIEQCSSTLQTNQQQTNEQTNQQQTNQQTNQQQQQTNQQTSHIIEQAHIIRCKALVQLGDWNQALLACRAALVVMQTHYEILHLTGKVLLEFQQASEAVLFFTRAIEAKGDHLPSWIARGLTYHHHLDDLARAVSDFHASITLNPTYYKTFFYMGMAMTDLSRHSLAIEAFSRSIALKDDYSESYFRRGVLRLQQQQLDLAITDFSKVTELVPTSAEAHYNCALAQHLRKHNIQAITSYLKCLEFQPTYLNALRNCAHAQGELGFYEASLETYSKALEICNQDAAMKLDILISRGHIWERHHNNEQALADYSEAIRLDASSARARTARGFLLMQSNKVQEAIRDFTAAIEGEPQNARNWNNRGTALMMAQKFETALTDFDRAIALSPGFLKAIRNRGKCSYLLQDFSSALKDLSNSLLTVVPTGNGECESFILRAHLHRKQGNLNAALKDLDKALEPPKRRKIRQEMAAALAWISDGDDSESGLD